jgi:ATP synthase F1 gamma subunit
MKNLKATNQEIVSLHDVHDLVTAYQEIAANEMQSIRAEVLKKRAFLTDINTLFAEVLSSYKHEIIKLAQKNKTADPNSLSVLKRNGKTAFVFLSANTGLYGDIIRKTFDLFMMDLKATSPTPDVVIIGELGKGLFEAISKTPYTYFAFSDQTVDTDTLTKCVAFLLQYETIYVYHGKFESVITQTPMRINVSGNFDTTEQTEAVVEKRYFFEPSLEKIVAYFESEIFATLVEQTLHESALAKFASRMVALEQAVDNVKGRVHQKEQEALRLKHYLANKKQQNSISSRFVQR